MTAVSANSIDLVVTSPPYPMIQMWDNHFSQEDPSIMQLLEDGEGDIVFERMHQQLDVIWEQVHQVLKPGGIACINIGDATRSLNDHFQLYMNHARIIQMFIKLGFTSLPGILWRKPTNSPTKFMGSGMLPVGAYVTLEHEHILIFRKGPKRIFQPSEQPLRRASAFFWEERNGWFSDVWMDLRGIRQGLNHTSQRTRSAAYPFELVYRLIQMYSIMGDTVLDPFLGTGTTTLAALVSARNSVGYEQIEALFPEIKQSLTQAMVINAEKTNTRLSNHRLFVNQRLEEGKPPKQQNNVYRIPVMSKQEIDLILPGLTSTNWRTDYILEADYTSD